MHLPDSNTVCFQGVTFNWGFLGGAVVKILPADAGNTRGAASVPGLGRSTGVGNGNPF